MNERKIHLWVVAIILLGPFVTCVSWLTDSLSFSNYLFPVTINSFITFLGENAFREIFISQIIVPLFLIKTLVIGVILSWKLFKNQNAGQLLIRFYLLIILICLVKLVGRFLIASGDAVDFGLGTLMPLAWIIVLLYLIKRLRVTMRVSQG